MNTAGGLVVALGLCLFLPFMGILTAPGFFLPIWGFGGAIGWVIAKVAAGKDARPEKAVIISIAYAIALIAGLIYWKMTGARLS